MHITLSPVRSDDALSVSRNGDTLTINGAVYDFSGIADGGVMARGDVGCDFIISDVTRTDGHIGLTLLLPHGPIHHPAPPEAVAVTHPLPLTITEDGPVTLPSYVWRMQ